MPTWVWWLLGIAGTLTVAATIALLVLVHFMEKM